MLMNLQHIIIVDGSIFEEYDINEGVIIEWPLNGQFNDARDVILKSRTDVR